MFKVTQEIEKKEAGEGEGGGGRAEEKGAGGGGRGGGGEEDDCKEDPLTICQGQCLGDSAG